MTPAVELRNLYDEDGDPNKLYIEPGELHGASTLR